MARPIPDAKTRITPITYGFKKKPDPWINKKGPFHYTGPRPLDFSAWGQTHHWDPGDVLFLTYHEFRWCAGDPRLTAEDWQEEKKRVMRKFGLPMWKFLHPGPEIEKDIPVPPDEDVPEVRLEAQPPPTDYGSDVAAARDEALQRAAEAESQLAALKAELTQLKTEMGEMGAKLAAAEGMGKRGRRKKSE